MNIITEKNRIKRHYFDAISGNVYNSIYNIPGSKRIDNIALELFFHLGYVPGNKTIFTNIECLPSGSEIEIKDNKWKIIQSFDYHKIIDKNKYAQADFNELKKIAGNIFLSIVEDIYVSNSKIIVPISGGYDSRAILAALLEVTDASNIITYTFGSSGTLDYVIGRKVAKYLGVKHYAFDLTKFSITQEKLIEISKLTDGNTDLFQPVFLLDVIDKIGTDLTIWSGYTGDGIGGSHYYQYEDNSIEFAINEYLKHDSLGYLDIKDLSKEAKKNISTNSVYKDMMTIHEEIFFANHVERYTVSHIFLNNCKYAVPFMDDRLIKFMFSVDCIYRENKTLFNSTWNYRYSDIFNIELKENFGFQKGTSKLLINASKLFDKFSNKISKNYVPKRTNYIDYSKKLRYDDHFYQLVKQNIATLKQFTSKEQRFYLDKALTEHSKGKRDNWKFLTAMASLGVIIQSSNR